MNPIGAYMDSDPETVAGVIQQMRASGKGIVGMEILGQDKLRKDEQMDLINRVAAA